MTPSILLVEDNEDDVFFLKRAMDKGGLEYPLHLVSNGRQALNYLQGSGEYADRGKYPLPRLVLLDLKLPQVPGLDVLKWIREQPDLQSMIVVILTSSHLDVDIDRAYRLGANSFLVKSSSAEHLAKMVRLIREYWLELNQPPPAGQSGGDPQEPASSPAQRPT